MSHKSVLTDRHIAILAAVARIEPCSAGQIARVTGLKEIHVAKALYAPLHRLGLVDWAIDRRYPQPRRQKCTIRVTEEGRQVLERLNGI